MKTPRPECGAWRAVACRQLPIVKVAQNWRFQDKPERVYAQGTAKAVLPGASVRDLGQQLKSKGYQARHLGCC